MLAADAAVRVKVVEHDVTTAQRVFRVELRIVGRRGFQHSDEHGAFFGGEVDWVLVEVGRRGGVDAVRVATEVHLIEIHLEVFTLAEENFLFAGGNPHFRLHDELAHAGDVSGQAGRILRARLEHIFDKLLCDSTCAASLSVDYQVFDCCYGAREVDTAVAVEPLVFGGDELVDHNFWNRVEWHIYTVLFVEPSQDLPIGRVDYRRFILLGMLDGVQRWRLAEEPEEVHVDQPEENNKENY